MSICEIGRGFLTMAVKISLVKLFPTIFVQYRSAMSLPGLTLKHPLLPRKLNRTVLIDG